MEFVGASTGKKSTPKMPAKRQVLGLRVTSDSNQGGRDHMEDMISIRYERRKDNDCAFFGVFDGHGGKEAAVFARDTLWDTIKAQRGFESKDPEKVKQAISEGFLKTQDAMWKKRGSWGTTKSGYPSTSGTTACVAIIRARHMWIAHVGDSRAVLGVYGQQGLKSRSLTTDHKPESPKEIKRIKAIGGKIQNKNGVQRVVWERTKLDHSGPVRRSTCVDQIPFLAVARSLGDLWSYSTLHDDYVVSPKPDISHHVLEPGTHQCVVIGSDGLWNMLSSSDAIYILSMYQTEKRKGEKMRETMAQRLVKNAINRWVLRSLRADNTTAVTIMIDFPKDTPKASTTGDKTEKTGDAAETASAVSKEGEGISSPSTPKEEGSCTPDEAKASTSSPSTSSKPECSKSPSPTAEEAADEDVGTELRIRGETDFVGVQGFGSVRPKLRHSNAFRDFVFRFHYPDAEELAKDAWEKDGWDRKRKWRYGDGFGDWDYGDGYNNEYGYNKRWKPDSKTYINNPVPLVSNEVKIRKKSSAPSPWLTPKTFEDVKKKKCGCFECHNNFTEYCLRRKKNRPKIEIVREYLTNPDIEKEEECTCFECTSGVPQFCGSSCDDSSPCSSPKKKNCRCLECKNGNPEFCKGKKAKGQTSPKKKLDSPFKQTRYNTRNSPTEPEVPLAQRALRSLNKSATSSTKPKKLYTPSKTRLNGRHRSAPSIKSC